MILAKLGPCLILTLFQLKILYSSCDFGKCLSSIAKKLLPMLVETLMLYGGLNHMIFLFLFLFLLIFLLKSGLNFNFIFKRLESTLLWRSLELASTDLPDDNLLIQREILSGKFSVLLGGWFNFTLIHSGILPGLI